jgi:hypothetical protein
MTKKKKINKVKPTAKYTLEDLKTKKIAVHLPTQEEWDRCMKWLEKHRVKWGSDNRATDVHFKPDSILHFVLITLENEIMTSDEDYLKQVGYTIITLDQIEGLEPTAEEGLPKIKNSSETIWFEYHEGITTIDLNSDTMNKVIIKYQGKEIVITREDFEGEIKLKCNDEAYSTSGRTFFGGKEDLGYAKGSRAWALLALDRGEKIRHNTWDKDEYIYLFDSTNSSQLLCEDDNFPEELYFHKDGWELYEEKVKPKTMTFAKMLETEGNCKFKFVYEDDEINVCGIWERDCGEVLLKKEGEETVKMNLAYIAKLGRKEVEIIEEKVCTN